MNAPAQSPKAKTRHCRHERPDEVYDVNLGGMVLRSNATIGCSNEATRGDFCEEHCGAPYLVEHSRGPDREFDTFADALSYHAAQSKLGWARLTGRDAEESEDHYSDGLTEVERELLGEVG